MCPVCRGKTPLKLREDTELRNFPLFCPKCRRETLIHVRQFHRRSRASRTDAEPIIHEIPSLEHRLCFFAPETFFKERKCEHAIQSPFPSELELRPAGRRPWGAPREAGSLRPSHGPGLSRRPRRSLFAGGNGPGPGGLALFFTRCCGRCTGNVCCFPPTIVWKIC